MKKQRRSFFRSFRLFSLENAKRRRGVVLSQPFARSSIVCVDASFFFPSSRGSKHRSFVPSFVRSIAAVQKKKFLFFYFSVGIFSVVPHFLKKKKFIISPSARVFACVLCVSHHIRLTYLKTPSQSICRREKKSRSYIFL